MVLNRAEQKVARIAFHNTVYYDRILSKIPPYLYIRNIFFASSSVPDRALSVSSFVREKLVMSAVLRLVCG